ncbi:hypothetical protein EH30_00140 [Erythrobacter sp. JL475]|nr:hypothetical protein EH30_00140 [Erythrobacter sp. JL475]
MHHAVAESFESGRMNNPSFHKFLRADLSQYGERVEKQLDMVETSIDRADTFERTAKILLEIARALKSNAETMRTFLLDTSPVKEAQIRYNERRWRADLVGDPHIAHGPAWDILLDLFIHSQDSREVSVTSAIIAAACPATTALRWLQVIEDSGFVYRSPDPSDSRRTFVKLTDTGNELVCKALSRHVSVRLEE